MPAGVAFHVLNRGNERRVLFKEPRDYGKFLELLATGRERFPINVFAYCLMPNHWHLIVVGREMGAISNAIQWIACRHACGLRRQEDTVGHGHVYQSRFHSFPIGSMRHHFAVHRYVEANALRAGLVQRAEDWRWGSLWDRPREATRILEPLPYELPSHWAEIVNATGHRRVPAQLQRSIQSGRPYGSPVWAQKTCEALRLPPHNHRGGQEAAAIAVPCGATADAPPTHSLAESAIGPGPS
jgi:putative transposase